MCSLMLFSFYRIKESIYQMFNLHSIRISTFVFILSSSIYHDYYQIQLYEIIISMLLPFKSMISESFINCFFLLNNCIL